MISPESIGIAIIMAIVIGRIRRKKSHKTYEVIPQTHTVEVEVVDEMTKEKVRNLFEEQDICNAKISHLMQENKMYQADIDRLNERIQANINEIETTMMLMPNSDIDVLKSGCERANENLVKHKLRLEGYIISNQERIVKYKNKSNEISMKIDKIGREIWEQRQQM